MTNKKINYKTFLSKEQYRITRNGETEAPYTGEYCSLFKPGTYHCICCNAPLFSSKTKLNTGGGWPDFSQAIKEAQIKYVDDFTLGYKRVEVKCNDCDAHLGHIFNDGPPPDYKRY